MEHILSSLNILDYDFHTFGRFFDSTVSARLYKLRRTDLNLIRDHGDSTMEKLFWWKILSLSGQVSSLLHGKR
jgi:hypothetical protein